MTNKTAIINLCCFIYETTETKIWKKIRSDEKQCSMLGVKDQVYPGTASKRLVIISNHLRLLVHNLLPCNYSQSATTLLY